MKLKVSNLTPNEVVVMTVEQRKKKAIEEAEQAFEAGAFNVGFGILRMAGFTPDEVDELIDKHRDYEKNQRQ